VDITGTRALITGASSGIGRSLALALTREGVLVAIAARRGELLDGLADEIESTGAPRPAVFAADLSKRGVARDLASSAVRAMGAVDILINNAGAAVGGYQAVIGDREEARDLFELNVWSPAALTAALVPVMRRRGTGAVVNVTSAMQVMPWPTMGSYMASKAALGCHTQTLRLELRGTGVHVMEVIPGPVATPMQGESALIPGLARAAKGIKPGSPDELAQLVIRALGRNVAQVVYPRLLRATYAVPAIARRFSARQAARLATEFDPNDERVVLSGSQGDDLSRRAREAWERGERDPRRLQTLNASGRAERRCPNALWAPVGATAPQRQSEQVEPGLNSPDRRSVTILNELALCSQNQEEGAPAATSDLSKFDVASRCFQAGCRGFESRLPLSAFLC